MHGFSFWSISEHLNLLKKLQMSPSVVLDGSQNHTVIVGKGSNTQKCWKTKEFVGAEGFSWRTADRLTVQDKQGTHEQKTQLCIIQVGIKRI